MSPADLADLRWQTPKQQNSLTPQQPVFLCEIMQQSCIPLRNLRYLRENNRQAYSSYLHNEPQCLPQISQMTQTNPNTTLTPNSLSLRNNAAKLHSLCVICVICGRIFTQEYSINPHKQKYLTLIPQTNHKNEQYRNCINTRIRSQYFLFCHY